MALPQLTATLALIAALADLPNSTNGLNAAQLKAKFDEAAGLIKTYINSTLLPALEATTAGSSGAKSIGATAITSLSGTDVQTILESLRNALKATTDSASGADFVAATAITGLTGGTVQALLEALKAYADTLDTAQTSALTTHKSSSDHDGRYYTETELNAGQLDTRYYTETELNAGQLDTRYYTKALLDGGQLDTRYFTETELGSTTPGTSGSERLGSAPITGVSGSTPFAQMTDLKAQINGAVLGQIPDGSLTLAKINNDIKNMISMGGMF